MVAKGARKRVKFRVDVEIILYAESQADAIGVIEDRLAAGLIPDSDPRELVVESISSRVKNY